MRKTVYNVFLITMLLIYSLLLVSCKAIEAQKITSTGSNPTMNGNTGQNGGPGNKGDRGINGNPRPNGGQGMNRNPN